MSEQNEQAKTASHKNEKIKSCTLSFKLLVIKHAKLTSIGAAERKFEIDRKRIREWITNENKIQNKVSSKSRGQSSKRLDGAGRKIKDLQLEETFIERITSQKSKNLLVSRKLIQRKARQYAEEKGNSSGQVNEFRASEKWLQKFMLRNGLSLRRRTTQAQKTPDQIIDKVIAYILYVRQFKRRNNYDLDCIIAMDETAVWHDMISNTTVTQKGAKSVVLKTTGHKKSRVTVTLAAKANGDKLRPYIVFPGHKREVQKLKKDPEVKNQCYIESTVNGWMNEDTTTDWIEHVLKTFTFGKRRLFAWDSYRAHLVQSVKDLLNKEKIDPVIIPGGATGNIQAQDISWNKPMKDQLREMYGT